MYRSGLAQADALAVEPVEIDLAFVIWADVSALTPSAFAASRDLRLKLGRIAHHVGRLFAGKAEASVGHNALGGIAVQALLGAVGAVVIPA